MPLILTFLLLGHGSPSSLPVLAPADAEAQGPSNARLSPVERPEPEALLRSGVRVVAGGEKAEPADGSNRPPLP